MKRLHLAIIISLTLASCSANNSADKTHADSVKMISTNQQQHDTIDGLLADTVKVKQWLIKSIEGYFKHYFDKRDHGASRDDILTDDYRNYKQDAINLDYDIGDSVTFRKKWQNKYDIVHVGHDGLFISGQDWDTVKVIQCNFLRHIVHDASVYKVVITTLYSKTKDNRDIKVIVKNGELLIDDVIEYN
jgi:hypothetical protein